MWRAEHASIDGETGDFVALCEGARFFDPERELFVARAPGRLDLMGGFADYSGALVLEYPLAAATWVAAQAHSDRTIAILNADADETRDDRVEIALDEIADLELTRAAARLTQDPRQAWAAYVAGAVVILQARAKEARSGDARARARASGDVARERAGVKLFVRSTVPTGKGVSSSAALEVASLSAIAALWGLEIEGRELGMLGQRLENLVVGAPCGVMDQMTSACGARGHLFTLLCQPAEFEGHLPLPDGLTLFGVDSGVRHFVSGRDYTSVRVATFMGYRIIADLAGLTVRDAAAGHVSIDDPEWNGYLANVSPRDWEARFRDAVPETVPGREFLARYRGISDPMTEIDPQRTYPVRACTAHPIYEHQRARRFRELVVGDARSTVPSVARAARAELGQLMFQSHRAYTHLGLGSPGTDRLVELVRQAGTARGLYGAKITGGGSGGSIVVLADSNTDSRDTIVDIATRYRQECGQGGSLIEGSSDGAARAGVVTLAPVVAPNTGGAAKRPQQPS